jgi:hypothetical protein
MAYTGQNSDKPKVDWDKKDRQIIRQNVLNRAVELVIAGEISLGEVYDMGEIFYEWVIADPVSPAKKTDDNSKNALPVATQAQQQILDKIKAKYKFIDNDIYGVLKRWPNNMAEAKQICDSLK